MTTNSRSLKFLCMIVVLVGLLQSIGYIINSASIRNTGNLTVASPLPLVFTTVKGIETFAQEFFLVYEQNEKTVSLKITPEVYSKLSHSYNLRNAIGAAVSYAPVLPDGLRNSALNYSFNPNSEMAKALNVPLTANNIRLQVTNKQTNESYWYPVENE